jgi:hypothetical protein
MSDLRPTPIPRFFEPDEAGLLRFLAGRIDLGDWDEFVDRYTAPPAPRDAETAEELKALVRSDFKELPLCGNDASDGLLCLPSHLAYGYLPRRTDPRVFEAFAHAMLMRYQLECGIYSPGYVSPRLIFLCGELGPECLTLCGRFVTAVGDLTEWEGQRAEEAIGIAAVLLFAAQKSLDAAVDVCARNGVSSLASDSHPDEWAALISSLGERVATRLRSALALVTPNDASR